MPRILGAVITFDPSTTLGLHPSTTLVLRADPTYRILGAVITFDPARDKYLIEDIMEERSGRFVGGTWCQPSTALVLPWHVAPL